MIAHFIPLFTLYAILNVSIAQPETKSVKSVKKDHLSGHEFWENRHQTSRKCRKSNTIEALDPETGTRYPLFNPRTQVWSEHFTWIDAGCRIQGLTPTGRATVECFGMNLDRLMIARSVWVLAGVHPPHISGE